MSSWNSRPQFPPSATRGGGDPECSSPQDSVTPMQPGKRSAGTESAHSASSEDQVSSSAALAMPSPTNGYSYEHIIHRTGPGADGSDGRDDSVGLCWSGAYCVPAPRHRHGLGHEILLAALCVGYCY